MLREVQKKLESVGLAAYLNQCREIQYMKAEGSSTIEMTLKSSSPLAKGDSLYIQTLDTVIRFSGSLSSFYVFEIRSRRTPDNNYWELHFARSYKLLQKAPVLGSNYNQQYGASGDPAINKITIKY